ncbi:MAG TPA: FAD-binding oxidoreductase [Steroidobacteraceae bacterium]|nr:FAD-binding oxidoreductase [Steroidobacteraceae bacterium]
MPAPNPGDETIAIVGAGVIGCAVAYALAREGRRVMVIDRADPGVAGASFGNVGHLAAELVEPLPSRQLLFSFWRMLTAFDGPLEIPMRRWLRFAPWALRFTAAAFRQHENTQHLAPLVRPATADFERWLIEIGRPDLMRRNGHYQFWFSSGAAQKADAQARHMNELGVPTEPASAEVLAAVSGAAKRAGIAGLWFNKSGHVIDPQGVCQAFSDAAISLGASFERNDVRALQPRGQRIEILTPTDRRVVSTAIVCAGAWSKSLLTPFGLKVPLEAARGYHVELAGHAPLLDAPIVYMDESVLVTPMASRLRASTYMEFERIDAPPDARKPARLRRKLQALGYRCDNEGPSWVGPRPVLPDYLPGIGRAPGPRNLFYAIGHQHIGLTLAPVTGELVADLVAGRPTKYDVAPFDLRRFG